MYIRVEYATVHFFILSSKMSRVVLHLRNTSAIVYPVSYVKWETAALHVYWHFLSPADRGAVWRSEFN
jgi:hypothetical protein